MSAPTKTQTQTAAESRENWWQPGASTSRAPDGLSVVLVQGSLEKCYVCWKTQLSVRTISSCQGVMGTHTWQQAAEALVVYAWEKGQEIAEGFALASWVMGMVSEWRIWAAGGEIHHETAQLESGNSAILMLDGFFMILWELGVIRHINQSSSLKLRQSEALMRWYQSSWGDTRYSPVYTGSICASRKTTPSQFGAKKINVIFEKSTWLLKSFRETDSFLCVV